MRRLAVADERVKPGHKNAPGRELPRRNYVDLMKPAEIAIRDAVAAVEVAGAHPLLTSAVNLLARAQEAVADFYDLRRLIQVECACTCADECPQGKVGSETRCTILIEASE
jgi:hypothetical protein